MNKRKVRNILLRFWRYRYFLLLASLLLWLLIPAIDPDSAFAEEFFLAAFVMIMICSLYILHRKNKRFWNFFWFGMLGLLFNTIAYSVTSPIFSAVAIFIDLAFVLSVIIAVIRHLFSGSRVDMNVLLESACLYLLLGILFSFVYTLIDLLVPNSFSGAINVGAHGAAKLFSSLLYYSFVTLTTTGYGDITPVSQIARSVSIIEAVVAQLYVAIFMSRLVGLHLNSYNK